MSVAGATIRIMGEVYISSPQYVSGLWDNKTMKKNLIIFLSLILLTFGLPSNSYAATDGCPDTWVIDTTQFPNSELESAKLKLGRNIVTTETREYSPKDNSWAKMPFYNSRHFPWIDQLPQRVIIKVEVKDCSTKSFIFPIQANSNLLLQDMSASEWSAKNPNKFRNFKLAEQWLSDISIYKNHIINMSKEFNDKKLLSRPKFINLNVMDPQPGYRLLIFNQECGTDLINPSVFRLKQGTICQLGIGTEDVVFERFEIQNGNSGSTINCVKGKVTKKVTGINPKCPTGYKKKL